MGEYRIVEIVRYMCVRVCVCVCTRVRWGKKGESLDEARRRRRVECIVGFKIDNSHEARSIRSIRARARFESGKKTGEGRGAGERERERERGKR